MISLLVFTNVEVDVIYKVNQPGSTHTFVVSNYTIVSLFSFSLVCCVCCIPSLIYDAEIHQALLSLLSFIVELFFAKPTFKKRFMEAVKA